MSTSRQRDTGRPRHEVARGFTLLEVVIVLSLLALIVAAAVPSFSGIQEERQLREPLLQLSQTAKEVRLLAMKEKRPYQIVFTAQGFTASRYLSPYLQLAEFQEYLGNQDSEIQSFANAKEEPAEAKTLLGFSLEAPPQKFETVPFGTGQHVQFQYWYEATPTDVAGNVVKLWVFQPNGLCEPIKVRFQGERSFVEATFSALTADISAEASGRL